MGIVTGVTFTPDVPLTSLSGEDSGSAVRGYDPRLLGWALKVPKRPATITDNVKTFLMMKFKVGTRTGNKADPVQVAREMKTLRNENGGGLHSRSAACFHVRQRHCVIGILMRRKS